MQFFKKAWQEIVQGENIELYVTVAGALLLVVLNLLGITTQALTTSFMVAILAMLAIAALGNRYRLEQLLRRSAGNTEKLFLTELSVELQQDLIQRMERAEDILIYGITLGRTLHLHYHLFEQKLKEGASIRILTIDPTGATPALTAQRQFLPSTPDAVRAKVLETLDALCKLKEDASNNLEIRIIEYPLAHGGIVVDGQKSNGVLCIWHYGYKTRRAHAPKHVLQPTDRYWYEHFVEESNAVWQNGTKWNCAKVKPANNPLHRTGYT
jgi:hypothetical protein